MTVVIFCTKHGLNSKRCTDNCFPRYKTTICDHDWETFFGKEQTYRRCTVCERKDELPYKRLEDVKKEVLKILKKINEPID